MERKVLQKTVLATLISIALSACGGGSSGSSNSGDNQSTSKINMQIIDGYLVGVTVCADLNNNIQCDTEEPSAKTDEKGKASVEVKNLESYSPFKLLATIPEGTEDVVFGKSSKTKKPFVLTRTVFPSEIVKNQSQEEQPSIPVNPFTTLVDLTVPTSELKNLNSQDYKEKTHNVAKSLGVDENIIDTDYNDPNSKNSKEHTKIEIAAEYIANLGLLPSSFEEASEKTEQKVISTENLNTELQKYSSYIETINNEAQDLIEKGGDVGDLIVENVNKNINEYFPDGAVIDPNTKNISLRVIDGYIEGAQVCLDVNSNLKCDEDEAKSITNIKGSATLRLNAEKFEELQSLNAVKILAVGDPNERTITDHILEENKSITSKISLSRTFFPSEYNKDTIYNITPFTSLADQTVSKDELSSISSSVYKDRLESIADILGAQLDIIESDYNNKESVTDDTVKALLASEILVKNNVVPQEFIDDLSVSTINSDLKDYRAQIDEASEDITISSDDVGSEILAKVDSVGASLNNFGVKIIDGYLAGIEVCISADGFTCLSGNRYISTTNANGEAHFEKSAVQYATNHYGNVKVIATSKVGTKDYINGEAITTTKNFVMTNSIFADAGNVGNTVIVTPFTSLVEQSNPQSSDEFNDRMDALAKGIDPSFRKDDLNKDYNKNDSTKDEKKLVVLGELITRSGMLPPTKDKISDNKKENFNKDTSVVIEDINEKVLIADELKESSNLSDTIESVHSKLGQAFTKMTTGGSDEWRCGITKTNNLYCWGNAADWSSLGNHLFHHDNDDIYVKHLSGVENTTYSNYPVPVEYKLTEKECSKKGEEYPCYENLQGVKDVAQANLGGCALTFNGEVYCWGGNWDGEIGNGIDITLENESEIGRIGYASKVVNEPSRQSKSSYLNNIRQITHGQKFACALSNDNEVFCWGLGGGYQLGSIDGLTPTPFQKDDKGNNIDKYGQNMGISRQYSSVPRKVEFPEEVTSIKSIYTGYDYSCAIVNTNLANDKHNVYCWGNDWQSMVSGDRGNISTYIQKSLDAGLYYDKVNDNCYDSNHYTRTLNKGTANEKEVCVYTLQVDKNYGDAYPNPYTGRKVMQHPIFEDAQDLALGAGNSASVTCALLKDTSVKCYDGWSGNYDQIMVDKTNKLTNVVKMYSSENSMYALTEEGYLHSWRNDNNLGLLGRGYSTTTNEDGTNIWESFAKRVVTGEQNDPSGYLSNIVNVSATRHSVCATVKASNNNVDFKVYCWGSKLFGQMGLKNNPEISWGEMIQKGEWAKYFYDSNNITTSPIEMPIGKDGGFVFSNPKE